MKKNIFISLLLSSLACLLHGCYYDNEEALYPEVNLNCDTVNVSYTKTISKIISENCQCHGESYQREGKGIRLDSYDLLKANITKVEGSVNHMYGFEPMPKNSSKLKSCYLRQIQIWRENNTPEN